MTLEIIKEKFYFCAKGNFQEEEIKKAEIKKAEIKKAKKIKDILEFLKNYNIFNITFVSYNFEQREHFFKKMIKEFLILKKFKKIEKIEIIDNKSDDSLIIYPFKKFKFKISYINSENLFLFDSNEDHITIYESNLNIIEEEIKEYKEIKEILKRI